MNDQSLYFTLGGYSGVYLLQFNTSIFNESKKQKQKTQNQHLLTELLIFHIFTQLREKYV